MFKYSSPGIITDRLNPLALSQVSRSNLIKAHPRLRWVGGLHLDLSLIKMCKRASMLYIPMALLQVNMGIWTPHYIKQNNSYHSLNAKYVCIFCAH